MNKIEAMTWEPGTKLGQDGADITMRFDSVGFVEHDVVTHNYKSGYRFHVTEVDGQWATCKFLTNNKFEYVPDNEIVMGSEFKILSF